MKKKPRYLVKIAGHWFRWNKGRYNSATNFTTPSPHCVAITADYVYDIDAHMMIKSRNDGHTADEIKVLLFANGGFTSFPEVPMRGGRDNGWAAVDMVRIDDMFREKPSYYGTLFQNTASS